MGNLDFPCAIGRSGPVAARDKREGDGCTPLGSWAVRAALFRPGRARPPAGFALPWRWIGDRDGWSDGPDDPCYNRPVTLPHQFSAEKLCREDQLYDIIIILGYNDDPPVPGRGSAIFWHIWRDAAATEGCVAIAPAAMHRLLPDLRAGSRMVITAS